MDIFGDSFQNMTADFDASDPLLDYYFRDVVLPVLVPQVYFIDPWGMGPATAGAFDNIHDLGVCKGDLQLVEGLH